MEINDVHTHSVRLPAGLMAVMGGLMDALAGALDTVGIKFQPTFTRSRVQYLTTHHYYSIEKASGAMLDDRPLVCEPPPFSVGWGADLLPVCTSVRTHPQAKRLLGYVPAWTQQEALDICLHSMMAELRNPKAPKPKVAPLEPSKGPAPQFTKEEVARHGKREDAWIVVDGKVRGRGGEGGGYPAHWSSGMAYTLMHAFRRIPPLVGCPP
jgi:hypothetical protein